MYTRINQDQVSKAVNNFLNQGKETVKLPYNVDEDHCKYLFDLKMQQQEQFDIEDIINTIDLTGDDLIVSDDIIDPFAYAPSHYPYAEQH